MMKLTVAFLAALAAADAAEARSTRQQRRQYGYGAGSETPSYGGNSYDNSYPAAPPAVSSPAAEVPVVSSKAPEVPATSAPAPEVPASSAPAPEVPVSSAVVPVVSSAVPEASTETTVAKETPSSVDVPYVQTSSPAFETSSSPADTTYPATEATPAPSTTPYPVDGGYGAAPPASSKVPEASQSSSVVVPEGGVSSAPVKESSAYPTMSSVPAESNVYSTGVVPEASTGVVPSGTGNLPGGFKPTGGYGGAQPSLPVQDATASSSGTGSNPYPTGTGSTPASSTPVSDMVTSTIYSTQIFTKTACPSTVTDCPASATQLVTTVVPVGTTVCPEGELPQATPVSVSTSEYPVSEITSVYTETLVYTIGVGSTAHPVTTEVTSTSTSTQYSTVIVTMSKPVPTGDVPADSENVPTGPAGGEGSSPAPSKPAGNNGGDNAYPTGPAGGNGEYPQGGDITSTISSTSTSTKYITVKPTPSGEVPSDSEGTPSGPAGGNAYPTGPAGGENSYPTGPAGGNGPAPSTPAGSEGGEGDDCGAPATITVTAKETVYVTKGSEKPTNVPEAPATPEVPSDETASSGTPAVPTGAQGMYPINNGTNPYPAGPTGFKTSTKPVVASETSSLPYFSFVSEVPSATKPADVPSKETEVPAVPSSTVPSAEQSSAPAGGDYGAKQPSSAVETPAVATSTEVYVVPSATPSAPADNSYGSDNGYGSGYGTY